MARIITMLVGPPGSGKSTLSEEYVPKGYTRISQDDQGKLGHWEYFQQTLSQGFPIVVDRMNFNKVQRERYLKPAKEAGYTTQIIVLHESFQTCLDRMIQRVGHPTVVTKEDALSALNTFFKFYERPETGEADTIEFKYPPGFKSSAVACDLDGTMCQIDHRLHHVRGEGKKDWKSFFNEIHKDSINPWCQEIVNLLANNHQIVFCSGRPNEYRAATASWLEFHDLPTNHLYMRAKGDYRPDYVVKEILLDYEILTLFQPYLFIDDRESVVKLWRRRGYVCLACASGDF